MIARMGGVKTDPKAHSILQQIINWYYHPIRKEPVFFILMLLLLAPAPLTSIITHFGELSCIRGTITGLCGGIAWSYLFTLISGSIHFKALRIFIKSLLYFIAIFLSLTYFILRYGFGKFITPSELSIIISTTPSEAQNFLATYLSISSIFWIFCFLTILILLASYANRIRLALANILHLFSRRAKLLIKVMAFICTLYGFYDLYYIAKLFTFNNLEEFEKWSCYWRIDDHYGDNLSKMIYSSISVNLSESSIKQWNLINQKAYKLQVSTSAEQDLKIVLIIGESFIRSHSSLYGYPIETNPCLKAEADTGNLVIFSDAVSHSSSTIDVIRNVLCTNDPNRGEMWYDSPYFPLLFSKAGWDVYYWDNQTKHHGDWSIFNFTMTEFLFNDFLIEHCYSKLYKQPYYYDGDIVNDYKNNYTPSAKNLLTIFHLNGQHFNAAWRYPNDSIFTKFNGYEITRNEPWMTDEKRKAIAHYDNATLYNDFVIKQIINLFRSDNSIIIYFSDHGEEVYDYRDSQGRKSCPENIKAQLTAQNSVPFVIWMSDKFIEHNPSTAQAIKRAANLPIITYDIANFIMGIAKMSTIYYRPENDFSSPEYQIAPRIIMDGLNYDEITK